MLGGESGKSSRTNNTFHLQAGLSDVHESQIVGAVGVLVVIDYDLEI